MVSLPPGLSQLLRRGLAPQLSRRLRLAVVPALHRLAAEPLAQFLLIGAGLFLLHAAAGSREPVGEIRVSQGQLASLAALHERVWMRPPTRRELDGLMEGWMPGAEP